ncbi:Wzz/FepE/Etk N-terminal domain-containing protein, partial [Candidatus Bipolaricaulota bacterium]|nr:Wzz/FepE/Etk N-terminal domain-containing protein [Candidatus Bipolaricaulota bacterium]
MEEYEVNLADYLRVLWRGKWIVIIITVAAVAAGIIFSLNIPSLYRARTQLMITPIIAEDVANAEMRPLFLAPETYRSLATARDLLREVGDAVYGPGEITVEALVGRMQVTIDGVEVFPLLTMTVIGSDPQVATDLANTWARLFMERNSAFLMSRIARSYDFIAATFAEVQTDLLAKEEERKVFERENPRDLLAAELDILQSLYQQNMTALEEKRNSLAT